MTEKTLSANYGEYYEKGAAFPQQLDQEELDQFLSLLPPGRLDVLDLGCAEGRLAVGLARAGHSVSVGDISKSQLRHAQEAAAGAGLRLAAAYECNIEETVLPFGDMRFDVIFFMDVVEHLKNPVIGLEHIRSLLKDDGTLILHTPNASTPHRFFWHLVRRGPVMDYNDPDKLQDFHFQTYDYLTLEKTLNFIGMKIREVVPTKVTLPRLFSSRLLARAFPLISDTLLVKCAKVAPIDLDGHLAHWLRTRPVHPERPGP
ncbi:MAG: class I SAM-dependent methyltransferase [Fibrobacteria bacterium]